MVTAVAPPPTKFGPRSNSAQAKPAAFPSRRYQPPPTKFAPMVAAPKIVAVGAAMRGVAQRHPAPVTPIVASRTVQRAAEKSSTSKGAVSSVSSSSSSSSSSAPSWPGSISVGDMTLYLVAGKKDVIYENSVHSGHAGSFHVTIHGISPTSERSAWDPAANEVHGRYYHTKSRQFGAQATRGGAWADSAYQPVDEAETAAQKKAVDLTSEACLRLAPLKFPTSASAHVYHTTSNPKTIFFS